MRTYEYIVLFKPDLSDSALTEAVEKVKDLLNQKGRVYGIDVWGKKKLAYEVKKYTKGVYVRYVCAVDPDHVIEVERVCRIADEVMRFLMVKLDDEVNDAKLIEEWGEEPTYEIASSDDRRSDSPRDRSSDDDDSGDKPKRDTSSDDDKSDDGKSDDDKSDDDKSDDDKSDDDKSDDDDVSDDDSDDDSDD